MKASLGDKVLHAELDGTRRTRLAQGVRAWHKACAQQARYRLLPDMQ